MSDIIKAQQGLARKAEVNRTHHFEDLYHLLCKREWIEEALQHVLDHDGAGTAGVDGMSWKSFNDVDKSDFENEKFRQHFIETLQEELRMLCWLHGTSVQKTHRLHQPDFPFLSLSPSE